MDRADQPNREAHHRRFACTPQKESRFSDAPLENNQI